MPEPEKNKIKYGLKNVHWAKQEIGTDGEPEFGTVKPWPGAVNFSMDPEGERSVFYADDGEYYVFGNNNGYSGDLETALVPDEFRTEILGEVEDDNGVLIEDGDAPAVPFALLFEFTGDVRQIRHVMYNCRAERPKVEGETKGENREAKTDTLSLKNSPLYFPSLKKSIPKAKTGANTSAAVYDDWYEEVYVPEITASSGTTGTGTGTT